MNKQKCGIYGLYGISSLCFLWFLCNLFLPTKYMILFGSQGDFPFVQRVLNVAAFISSTLLAMLYYIRGARQFGEKVLLGLVIGGLGFLTLSVNFVFTLLDDTEYYKFISPDYAHTIVIGERSFLQAGGVIVYEQIAPFLFQERGEAVTDDGYRPICNGAYSLDWKENQVHFSFQNGEGANEQITVEFLQ